MSKSMLRGGILVVWLLVGLLVLSACTAGYTTPAPLPKPSPVTSPTATPSPSPTSVTMNIAATGFAFDRTIITVTAGSNVTINFDNKDSGIPHNVAFYNNSTASTTIYKGQIITGPSKAVYTFTAPTQKGTYFFRCDVHPGMNGQFIVN